MGYGFMAFSVDVEKLKQVAGSKDEKLVRMIGGRFKDKIRRRDEWNDDGPGLKVLLAQIVNGEPLEDPRRHLYAYAFELLVEHFGKFLDNGAIYPFSMDYIDQVDAAFKQMGVSDVVSLSRFWTRGLPVPLPRPDDFPGTGYMTADEVATANERLRGAPEPTSGDPDVVDAVACVRGWLAAAAAANRGIVAYYY